MRAAAPSRIRVQASSGSTAPPSWMPGKGAASTCRAGRALACGGTGTQVGGWSPVLPVMAAAVVTVGFW